MRAAQQSVIRLSLHVGSFVLVALPDWLKDIFRESPRFVRKHTEQIAVWL